MEYLIANFSGALFRIRVSDNVHETGGIWLYFRNPQSEQLASMAHELKSKINAPFLTVFMQTIYIADYQHGDKIFGYLKEKNLIAGDSNLALLAELGKRVAKNIQTRENLVIDIKPSDHELLEFMVDPYISDIFASSEDHEVVLTLLKCAFYFKFNALRGKLINYLDENNVDQEVIEIVDALWKICHGEANLESTFSRISQSIPVLGFQRAKLGEICTEQLKKKFGDKFSDEDYFLMLLSFKIYIKQNQTFSPFYSSNKFITQALSGGVEGHSIESVFKPSLLGLATQCFADMGILRENDERCIARLRTLQQTFNSHLLADYIKGIENLNANNRKEDASQFVQGIKELNLTKVRRELEQKADVNQFLVGGLTPLLHAIQKKSKPLMMLLLYFGANVDQSNQARMFWPIASVIYSGSVELVDLLLAYKPMYSDELPAGVEFIHDGSHPPKHVGTKYISALALASKELGENPDDQAKREIVQRLLQKVSKTEKVQPHELLVNELESFFGEGVGKFSDFFALLHQKKYINALSLLCMRKDNFWAVEIFLEYQRMLKFDLNKVLANKKTVLHSVALRGDDSMYRLFLAYGANTNLKDEDGKTAFEYLQLSHYKEVDRHTLEKQLTDNVNQFFRGRNQVSSSQRISCKYVVPKRGRFVGHQMLLFSCKKMTKDEALALRKDLFEQQYSASLIHNEKNVPWIVIDVSMSELKL